eukprot:CAMPEP_0176243494 /NCGR_PEP_ID=MMETSP0121_2-20121125/30952_1 /TAXON_ID=160619 /ORGANISM="Kryptoperidinium foliaceum, Strain CCMP 1326" /LENGTH=49 /DNA_ID= /DNA_START= /DNA_END= /DNA_ORIENTATION=
MWSIDPILLPDSARWAHIVAGSPFSSIPMDSSSPTCSSSATSSPSMLTS